MNRAGKLIIVSPIDGSPAKAAGIRAGDIVLEVDGESLEGIGLMEAVALIRGPKGSVVTLLVKHLGDLDPVEIEITRGVILLPSIYLRSEPDDRYAHIRVTDFYPNTVTQLKETLKEVIDDGAQGLILDLRNNPGGTLDSVVDVASQFLDGGLVLYQMDGNGNRIDYSVRKGGIALDIPTVVLVNEGSASSSEVLVGALQDRGRATIIGSTTYGKGSVNHMRRLSNGGGLYITIGYWYTPLGRLIQEDGLKPDILVESRDPQTADIEQLKRAKSELDLLTNYTE
jgi:carboxyl-terminal processing protease